MNRRERFTSENLVQNPPDRPSVVTRTVTGGLGVGEADRLVIRKMTPLTFPRVLRGQTIGGGTSKEAIRRAKRRLGRKGSSSLIDYNPQVEADARRSRIQNQGWMFGE